MIGSKGLPVNSSQAPEILKSFSTLSVGLAPFLNQWMARSLSMFILDGSCLGSYVPIISIKRPFLGDLLSAATRR